MIDVTDVVGMLPHPPHDRNSERGFDDSEPVVVRLYDGDDAPATPDFFWPYAEMPETD